MESDYTDDEIHAQAIEKLSKEKQSVGTVVIRRAFELSMVRRLDGRRVYEATTYHVPTAAL